MGASAERLSDWLPFYLVDSEGQITIGKEHIVIYPLMPFGYFYVLLDIYAHI